MINIAFSVPEEIIQKIDNERGEINRSRYITLLLKAGLESIVIDKKSGKTDQNH